jgi:hypothetical protein
VVVVVVAVLVGAAVVVVVVVAVLVGAAVVVVVVVAALFRRCSRRTLLLFGFAMVKSPCIINS